MEKVIKGLETCIPMKYETSEEKECRHEQCPYGRENYKPMNGCFWDLMSDALATLKEQEKIIKLYQKADGFLFAHGWKWENYIDTQEEAHSIEVGEDGLPY